MFMSMGVMAVEPCTAEIRTDSTGQPVLHINGDPSVFLALKPIVGSKFYTITPPILPMVAGAGVHIYNIDVLPMNTYWDMAEDSALIGDEGKITTVLAVDPDAYFIVDVGFTPGSSWVLDPANDPEKIRMFNPIVTGVRVMSPEGLVSNAWHHVVATYDGEEARLYVNGTLVGQSWLMSELIAGEAPTLGGGFYENETANPFLGIIDEVKLYDRALAAAEVTQTNRTEAGLLAHWNFEDPDTIKDISGNGFDGVAPSYQREEGEFGYGLLCTGPESVVTIPSWSSEVQIRTLEMRIKPPSGSGGYRHLFNNDQFSFRQEPLVPENDLYGRFEFFLRGATGFTVYKQHNRNLSRPHPFSENANSEFSQRLQSWIPRLEEKYGDRIIGYYIHASWIGEWYYDCIWNGFVPGFDSWTEAGLRDFAMARYQTIDAVNQAWGKSYAAWDEITYPTYEERFSRDEKGEFFDPDTDRYLIDFFHSLNTHWGTMAKRFSTEIKDLTGRKKIVGLFHQYLLPASRTSTSESGAGLNHSGQLDTMSVIQHPDIDVIGAPPAGYFPWMFMGTPESIALHGKMPLLENDMKTHRSNWPVFMMKDLDETLASYRYCFEKLILPRRSAMWFYDIAATAEDTESLLLDPEIWNQVAQHNQVLQDAVANPVPYQPNAAIVFSEQTPLYMPSKTPVTEFIYDKAAKEMDQAFGTKVWSYLNEDFVEGRIQGADYIFVPSTFVVTPEERDKIHAFLRNSGATVIWLYAPGYIDPEAHQASVSNMTALTGIQVEAMTRPVKDEIKPIFGAWFGTGIEDLRPQFYIPPQDHIRTLGVYRSNQEYIAIAEKQMEGWRSIYCVSPAISAEFIRSIRPAASSFFFSLIARPPSAVSIVFDGATANYVDAQANVGTTGAQTLQPGEAFTQSLPYSTTVPKWEAGTPVNYLRGPPIYAGHYLMWRNNTASTQTVNSIVATAYRNEINGCESLLFLNGANTNIQRQANFAVLFERQTSGTYGFGSASQLTARLSAWQNRGEVTNRWVVVAGGITYVSESAVGALTNSTAAGTEYTISNPDEINWAVWNPGANLSFGDLVFDVPGYTIANITHAGYAENAYLASGTLSRNVYVWGFRCDLYIDPGTPTNGPEIRVAEYYLTTGDFSGTNATVTLDPNLASDYFILVRGARTGDGLSYPDNDYARVSAVPGGRVGLNASGEPNQIRLSRHVADVDWEGVVTVVECGNTASPSGFRLVDIIRTPLERLSGTSTSASWNHVDQVVPFGGYRSGCRDGIV